MKVIAVVIGFSVFLAGCSSTPADLEAKAQPTIQNFNENYQEIYRRTSSTAKRCIAGNVSAYASMAVDTELYSDLGYGEMTVSLINWGTRNYFVSARIEKAQPGARLIVRAGNTLGAENFIQSVLRWANGDPNC
jgi:hypothetical protein